MDGDFFAGVPVRDRAVAVRWYEALLAAPPAFFPNEAEAVWALGERRFLYVEVRPDDAGHAMHTVFVEDLGARLADIEQRGLRATDTEQYENGVTKAIFPDPDGNEFSFTGGPRVSA